jgi:tetratricopeptide (TPR) repeat protein
MLASNGYVVAMIFQQDFITGSFAEVALSEVPSMQLVMNFLKKTENIDETRVGTFGFSGSGFTQVLFSMYDTRIKAVADIESGIYMNGLYQQFSRSNYYHPSELRIPFLHIFSRSLSKEEKYISDFEQKTKFSNRYRLLLNEPKLHHWDFAAEGYTSCIVLNQRGVEQMNIQQSFEVASQYLLNFFNSELKSDLKAKSFLTTKPTLAEVPPSLWDITVLPSLKPAPNSVELDYIIRKKGIVFAMETLNKTIPNDSSTNIMEWFVLNNLGSTFFREKKYTEAIEVFKFNTRLHPDDANLHDSLAEGYEAVGDKDNMKKVSEKVLELLSKKTTLTDAEKSLKETAERRLKL